MTWFGPKIEPITSPTPGGCTTVYPTDAGYLYTYFIKSTAWNRKGVLTYQFKGHPHTLTRRISECIWILASNNQGHIEYTYIRMGRWQVRVSIKKPASYLKTFKCYKKSSSISLITLGLLWEAVNCVIKRIPSHCIGRLTIRDSFNFTLPNIN